MQAENQPKHLLRQEAIVWWDTYSLLAIETWTPSSQTEVLGFVGSENEDDNGKHFKHAVKCESKELQTELTTHPQLHLFFYFIRCSDGCTQTVESVGTVQVRSAWGSCPGDVLIVWWQWSIVRQRLLFVQWEGPTWYNKSFTDTRDIAQQGVHYAQPHHQHGFRKDCFQGGQWGIFLGVAIKIFRGGAKSDEISFFLLETKKTTILC